MSWFDSVIKYNDDDNGRSTKMHLPNPDLVIANLKELDLSNLRTINFKGGEPFLNSETTAILKYLDEQNILSQVSITVSTNGTYINDETLELLKKCKLINLYISVDGVGDLFNYIRYGDAKFEDIEPTIAKLNTVTSINIQISVAVMNYNAFNLIDIRSWTIDMSVKYDKVSNRCGFSNCLTHPTYLSLLTLSDETRKELIDAFARLPSSFQVGMPTIFPSPIMYITQKENGIFKIVFKPNGYAAIHKLSEKFNLKMEGFKRQDQF
jgi:hypothetical protein